MSNMLPDGSVLPLHLTPRFSDPRASIYDRQFNNDGCLVGTVVAAYKPSDSKNQSKTVYEYDVKIESAEGLDAPTSFTIARARMFDLFGGVADTFYWTPRVLGKNQQETTVGSEVMVFCPNGNTRLALIVGGVINSKVKKQPELGHHLFFEFNGVNIQVTDEGELRIIRQGVTKSDGTPKDQEDSEKHGFNTIVFRSNGSLLLSVGPNATEFIEIDDENHEVNIDGDNGVHLGGTDEPLVLGKTYCKAEADFLQDMNNAVSAMKGAVNQLVAGLNALSAPPGGGPVVGAQVAGAAAQQLGAGLDQLSGAIQTFSSNVSGGAKAKVLSQYNTTK